MPALEDIFRHNLPIIDKSEVWDWGYQSIDFGSTEAFKGAYDVMNVPWTKRILFTFKDPRVRKTTSVMPPQESGKTKAAEVCLAWRVCNRPAKIQFNFPSNQKAETWNDTRWKQLIASCAALRARLSSNPDDSKKRLTLFRDGSFLIKQGVESENNRQSDSIEVQINDELYLWERPWLEEMNMRQRAFRIKGVDTAKQLNLSVGGEEDSELHDEFMAGTQEEWSHHCPGCGRLFQYEFDFRGGKSNIHFDKSAAKVREDGTFDFTEFDKTVYVTCPHCGHRMDYDEHRLADMNRKGEYVVMNPNPDYSRISLHVNSFAIGRRPWAEIIHPFIKATMGRSVFATSMLKDFIIKELCGFWKEKPVVVMKDVRKGSYTRAEMRQPGFWKDEWIRVMTMDNQRGAQGDIAHRWFLVRAFSKDGKSRLVDCGRVNEWEEARQKQLENLVPDWAADAPGPWAAVDRAHKPQQVDEVCARYKWYGLLGQETVESYFHGKSSDYAGSYMYFSEMREQDTGFGTADEGREFAYYYLYVKQRIEDMLADLRAGKAEEWELPADIDQFCPEYLTHINSHHQVMESTKNGNKLFWRGIGHTPDHLYDCECMAVVLGLMSGAFRRSDAS
jgi:sarcosine oxidase delta subunit